MRDVGERFQDLLAVERSLRAFRPREEDNRLLAPNVLRPGNGHILKVHALAGPKSDDGTAHVFGRVPPLRSQVT
jgi:hypothetical protein